jgi:predicted site-specific integrase-resolvase
MTQQYRPKKAAELLGIGLSTFWLYVKNKKLVVTKLSPRVTVVSDDELNRFLSK